MKSGDLVCMPELTVPREYGMFFQAIKKLDGRVLQFYVRGRERLICEQWWLANGGESVEEEDEKG